VQAAAGPDRIILDFAGRPVYIGLNILTITGGRFYV
jgi:hypothetical protein